MEEIHNLITGCLVPSPVEDQLGDSEDEGGDEMQWLGYNEVTQLGHGKSLVPYERPKRFKGNLINLQNGRSDKVAGMFHFSEPWWQTAILRTKKTKDKYIEPKDYFALCYRLRDDPKTITDRVFDLFISKVGETDLNMPNGKKLEVAPWFENARRDFEAFLSSRIADNDLDILSLEGHLEAYVETLPEELRQMPTELESNDVKKYQPLLLKKAILQSTEHHRIKVAEKHPNLLHYLPQLFPGNFTKLISLDMGKLKKLSTLIDEEPGFLAFKKIMSKECGIMGCETSYEALRKAGLMPKIDQDIRDAILMYEFIKKETKENGHTYVHYNRILDVLGSVVQLFEEALVFLNKHKVTKTQVENSNRIIFLTQLWQAENKIALGISSLIEDGERLPWELKVDWESEDFDNIRGDNDQLRAAQLIASKPVVAISGKGGCGKTYVVTKVITAAKAKNKEKSKEGEDCEDTQPENDNFDATQSNNVPDSNGDTQPPDEVDFDEGIDDEHDTSVNSMKNESPPETIELLLTAPTGKAANLLGKRAKCPSFTLHQVIFSFRSLKEGMPWKHKDVNILVVDECSLVSVSTFSFLIELLLEHAQLKRIVLLGDVRQLPSIEPGNFLSDTFSSLARLGCAVELRNNHRAESELIVHNATRISLKTIPVFNPEQFMFRKLPPSRPNKDGNDYADQDISEEVRKLLQHEALQNHVNSQFISFTRRICESINDLCCKHYSDHRTKEYGKSVFRTGDKICCTKNGYVNVYEDQHGMMSCYSQNEKSALDDEESQGGVNRLVDPNEDTSLLGTQDANQSNLGGTRNTTASSSSENKAKKPNQIRLCNGEIFFILEELEKRDDENHMRTFLLLSDKDAEKQFEFYVDKLQLKKACKISHAWARTIHTFQGSETDNVVYIVGNYSRRQNWQHVYTAVTRGRKSVFIIGQEIVLRDAIKRSEIKRQTSLRKQLLEKLQKNKDFNATHCLQTSVLNRTALNVTSYQSQRKKQERHISIAESLWSHEQKIRPMKNDVTPGDGDNTLNNTQMVTDILTSLAQDHDDGDAECNSDDSQSLLSTPNPRNTGTKSASIPSTSGVMNTDRIVPRESWNSHKASVINLSVQRVTNSNVKLHDIERESRNAQNKELIESDVISEEEMDVIRDPDSDDSQSMISPPITRVKSYTKGKCEKADGDSNNCIDKHSFSHLKNKSKTSKLSLRKGKIPLTMISSSSVDKLCKHEMGNGLNSRKVRYSFGSSTSGNVPKTQLVDKNCLTHGTEGERSMNSSSKDIQCRIRTGFSLMTPGCDTSLGDLKSNIISPLNPHSSCISTPEPSSYFTRLKEKGRLNISDDINEPKSNESNQSQWSEIDDSAYINLDDSIVGGRNNTSAEKPNSSNRNVSDLGTSRRSTGSNISTNSQWSEVDDDQYMTLDLEDIKEMNYGNHDNHVEENGGAGIDIPRMKMEQTFSRTDDQECSNSEWRESEEFIVPNTPPSPSILETPPKCTHKSPSRKRVLNLDINEGNGVSPIKHSLSKLRFL